MTCVKPNPSPPPSSPLSLSLFPHVILRYVLLCSSLRLKQVGSFCELLCAMHWPVGMLAQVASGTRPVGVGLSLPPNDRRSGWHSLAPRRDAGCILTIDSMVWKYGVLMHCLLALNTKQTLNSHMTFNPFTFYIPLHILTGFFNQKEGVKLHTDKDNFSFMNWSLMNIWMSI